MEISSAPSIVDLANRVRGDLRGGKMVLFHLPFLSQEQMWQEELVDAICDRRSSASPMTIEMDATSLEPELEFVKTLDGQARNIEEALQVYAMASSPVVLSVSFKEAPSEGWQKFIAKLGRLYEKGAEEGALRGLMVFCHGMPSLGTKPSPAVKCVALWNALRWEDMRCLASAWLEVEDCNPLMRNWQISTFAGAANGDPFLLREICLGAPKNLTEIRSKFIVSMKKAGGTVSPGNLEFARSQTRWSVPESCVGQWSKGELLGMTLDRGPQIPWQAISAAAIEDYEERLIWQEQVTSLLPTLMEFTRQAGFWISSHVTAEWERYVVQDGDPYTAVEPGKILYIFKSKGLGSLPDSLDRLLKALKDARNDLAHTHPLDAGRVAAVWDAYCLAQEKYGKKPAK